MSTRVRERERFGVRMRVKESQKERMSESVKERCVRMSFRESEIVLESRKESKRIGESVSERERTAQAQYTSCNGMKCSTHKKHCVYVCTMESLIRMTGSPCLPKAN